jgi:hypothetical protein
MFDCGISAAELLKPKSEANPAGKRPHLIEITLVVRPLAKSSIFKVAGVTLTL